MIFFEKTRLKTGFECMTVRFIKILSETFRDFQRLSETLRDFQRLSEFFRDFFETFSRLSKFFINTMKYYEQDKYFTESIKYL